MKLAKVKVCMSKAEYLEKIDILISFIKVAKRELKNNGSHEYVAWLIVQAIKNFIWDVEIQGARLDKIKEPKNNKT